MEYSFEETEVGSHTFRVRATDPEGNTDPTPATYTWTITGIVATVTSGPAFVPAEGTDPATGGETVDTTATFTFEANVADATFRCSIDGLAFTACTSPVTYTGLAIGDRLFQVYAIDPEGAEQIEATRVRVDHRLRRSTRCRPHRDHGWARRPDGLCHLRVRRAPTTSPRPRG